MTIDKLLVDNLINKYIVSADNALLDEMQYATSDGGRLRSILFLQAVNAFGGNIDENAERLAVALELVHCYSLVHDDLPCMDNDMYRRGKLTCHAKYGEARAVLCGDALLNCAIQVFLGGSGSKTYNYLLAGKAIFDASSVFGGMIAGQVADLFGENNSLQEIVQTDLQKTGALISVAICSAGLLAGIDEPTAEQCLVLGKELGLVYQFYDDILDQGEQGNSILKVLDKNQAIRLCLEKCDNVRKLADRLFCGNLPFLVQLLDKIEGKLSL